MSKLQIIDSALVYRNTKPYLRAIHAFHPCLSRLSNGDWIATFDVGQGAESLDYRTILARSRDGVTWDIEKPILPSSTGEISTTHSIRTAALADGRVMGIGARFYREDPEEGILNRDSMGLYRTDLISTESHDMGESWSVPRVLKLPLPGEAWEASHCPLELPDGTIGLPLAAWRDWKGELPDGEQSVIALSLDGGATWPRFLRTFDGRRSGYIHWEQCVIPFGGGLLAVAWVYDPATNQSLPSVFSWASTMGGEFSPACPTGYHAETCEIFALGGSEVLSVYRRADQPGLWAETGTVENGTWRRHSAIPIWQGAVSGMGAQPNAADSLSDLKFGSPSIKRMDDGTILVLFWCQEEGIGGIRWVKLAVVPS